MDNKDYIEFDFSYIDEHLNMIKSKIIKKGSISIFNGFLNKIYIIEKDDDNFKFFHSPFGDKLIEINYESLIEEIMMFYKTSMGKLTLIYRVFTETFNPKTNAEFRELWGDVLYVSLDTLKFTSVNISAENLSNIVMGLNLSEEDSESFGKPEDYIFKDNEGNLIMGVYLI